VSGAVTGCGRVKALCAHVGGLVLTVVVMPALVAQDPVDLGAKPP
jgi:hypothetical protein